MSRTLGSDPLTLVRYGVTTLGIAAAVLVWLELTRSGGLPVDVHTYWAANPADLYPHPELGERNGYNYSPAFEFIVGWGRNLPFEAFAAIWRALLLATLVYLAGPLTILVIFLPPVASEINAGNIQLFLALAVVWGFRWPGAWAFVVLTKLTPGVGLLWFALRRKWRALLVAAVVTATVALLAFVIHPDAWPAYVRLMTGGPAPAVSPYYLSFWTRLPFALAFVAFGAWRGYRWPVVVAATLALPVFYYISPSMLVGVLPFLREAGSRWIATRTQGGGVRLALPGADLP